VSKLIEVSNKTLTSLFIAVVAITLVGTTISLIKLDKFEIPLVTGMATYVVGKVNISIAQTTAVAFVSGYNLVDFGNGTIDTSPHTRVSTILTDNPSTFNDSVVELRVQNDGNVDVNVSLNGSTAATFLGGTNPSYEFNASCMAGTDCGCLGTTNQTAALANITTTPALLCTNLTFGDAADALGAEIELWVPTDAAKGGHQDTLIEISVVACGATCK